MCTLNNGTKQFSGIYSLKHETLYDTDEQVNDLTGMENIIHIYNYTKKAK